jgi:hypothetical protein
MTEDLPSADQLYSASKERCHKALDSLLRFGACDQSYLPCCKEDINDCIPATESQSHSLLVKTVKIRRTILPGKIERAIENGWGSFDGSTVTWSGRAKSPDGGCFVERF